MALNNTNRYARYRRAAGFTQERAAELIGCSVESIKAYETGLRLPPEAAVVTMCDVYGAPTLAFEHLRAASELGAVVVPEVQPVPLAQAVCELIRAIRTLEKENSDDCLLSIAADGRVDELEEEALWAILADLEDVVEAAMTLRCCAEVGMNGRNGQDRSLQEVEG